jgi:hypothetical protein
MSPSRLPTVILIAALACGALVRLQGIAARDGLTHDEGISYLAATGHQGAFSRLDQTGESPVGVWVPARDWQRFLAPDRFACFSTIGSDLAATDIHPPLYFWLLHVWIWAVGVHLWSGPVLNLLISLGMIVALYRLAYFVFEERLPASLVAFLWGVSPYVAHESLEARPYGLLALFAVLLVWQSLRILDGTTRTLRSCLLLAAITAGGTLTHYHFAIAAVGMLLVALAAHRGDRVALVRIALSIAGGCMLFAALHPHFVESFRREQAQAQVFSAAGAAARALEVALSLARSMLPATPGTPGLVVFASLLVVGGAIAWVRAAGNRDRATRTRLRSVLALLAWVTGCIAVLYVTFLSPEHAMGPKYLSMTWPLLMFVPVALVWLLTAQQGDAPAPRRSARTVVSVSMCAWMLLYAGAQAVATARGNGPVPRQAELLAGAQAVLVDSVARGVLPRVIWDLSPDTEVLAAPQDAILAGAIDLGRLGSGGWYVTHPGYGNTEAKRDRVLRRIGGGESPTRVSGGLAPLLYFRLSGAR